MVGIGLGAGGMAALDTLLGAVPTDCGMAFLVLQQGEPAAADGLAVSSAKRVLTVEDGLRVHPDTVYLAPPASSVDLFEGRLRLAANPESPPSGLPIDLCFRSLAQSLGPRAVVILLSGTGPDGLLGTQEIKAAGGMVMVQAGGKSELDGAAVAVDAASLADCVLPVGEMAGRLLDYIRHPYVAEPRAVDEDADWPGEAFGNILRLLTADAELDFRSYKRTSLVRRIQRRMGLRQVVSAADYLELLRIERQEVRQLFKDLLIGVTSFFREPEAWAALADQVIAPLVKRGGCDGRVRAWIPGCSTGEEAYSLAILLVESLEARGRDLELQLFATDVDEGAIAVARAGIYSPTVAAQMSPMRLQRFFEPVGDRYRVNQRLRDSIVFARQNVLADPPISDLEIISCRNLIIYLESPVQRRLAETFHFALREQGCLFLGASESALGSRWPFEAISQTHRIYRPGRTVANGRLLTAASWGATPARALAGAGDPLAQTHEDDHLECVERALLQRFVPATVVTNRELEVQYYHGPLRKYLDFPSGEPTTKLPAMALEGLRRKLHQVLDRALNGNQPAVAIAHGVHRDDERVSVRIGAEPFSDVSGGAPGLLVHFQDQAPPRQIALPASGSLSPKRSAEDDPVWQLEYELRATREDLQSTIEELETANEELKASNEEITSMNEELQVANEEIEASRMQLQSLNVELASINAQLEDKLDELEASNSDLTNLIVSTDVATLFLDTEFRVRRFTPAARELLHIDNSDLGRAVHELSVPYGDPDLLADARHVLDRQQPAEVQLQGQDGRYLMRRVRPYRTSDSQIRGVVITYTDISALRRTANRLAARERQQAAVSELGVAALGGSDIHALCDQAVRNVARHLEVPLVKALELQADGKNLLLRSGVGWQPGLVGSALIDAGPESQAGYTLKRSGPVIVEDLATERRFTGPVLLPEHGVVCGLSVIVGPVGRPWGVLGAHETSPREFTVDDVNFLQATANTLWLAIAQVESRRKLEQERAELRHLTDALPFNVAIVGPDLRYRLVNQNYEKWGLSRESIEGMQVSELLGEDNLAVAAPLLQRALDGEPVTYELEIRRPDGGKQANLVSYIPRRGAAGECDGLYLAAVDISRLKEAEREVAQSRYRLNLALDGAKMGTWEWDPATDRAQWDERLDAIIGIPSAANQVGASFFEHIHPDDLDRFWQAIRECTDGSGTYRCEFRLIRPDGSVRWLAGYGALIDADGGRRMAGVNFDITERKLVEERNKVISAELDHRVKNLLATVSTIARMTGRSARTIEEYRETFESRLLAMSRTHSALATGNWDGLQLRVLLEQELAPYRRAAESIHIAGPPMLLTPKAAQTLSMVFHELATNAAKYGALGTVPGRLTVTWEIENEGTDKSFRLVWTEYGVRTVAPPTVKGFGSTVLQSVAKAELAANVQVRFEASGLCYTLQAPVARLTAS